MFTQVPSIEALNEILLEGKGDGYRHNLLSSIAAYNKEKDIVVEAAIYQDVINIYSLRKAFELSIVTGENINTIEEMSTLPDGDFKDATAFDIDWDNRFLYTYNIETERLLRYNIGNEIE